MNKSAAIARSRERDGPGTDRDYRSERRTGIAILLVCLVAYGYFLPRGPSHNPDSRLALTYSLVERGTLAIDAYAASTEDRALRDGHYYSDKAPGVSLALAPLYALLRALGLPDQQEQEVGERFITRYLLTFLGVGVPAALFATWLFHWLRRYVMDAGPRAAVVMGLALGSPVWAYTTHAFGHVPAGIALFGGYALLRDPAGSRRRMVAAGALLGAAVLFEYPAAVPALVLAGLACIWGDRRWSAAQALAAGALPPLLVLGVYHTLAFGAPWLTGYAYLDPASQYAEAQRHGLLGISVPHPWVSLQLLAGEYRGLLWTAPWVVLAIPGAVLTRRSLSDRRDLVAGVAVFLALLVVNSGYAVWHGGAAWGPRHLVPVLPFLVPLALPAAARRRGAAWALAGAGVLLSLAVVASGALPLESVRATLREYLLANMWQGRVTNNWGHLLGLTAWRSVVPLAMAVLGIWAWARGLRQTYGIALATAVALVAAAQLDRRYLEFTEGYFLYLGARMADGAVLYRDTASTQPPVLPWLISLLWRIQPDVWLPRLLAIGCYLGSALLAGRLAAQISGDGRTAPLATAIAAVLPLGASTPMALDANALSALLAAAVALLVSRGSRRQAAAGVLAGIGVGTKLTFLALALVPGAVLLWQRERSALTYAVSAAATVLSIAGVTALVSGAASVDAWTGELGSRLLPASAMLAVTQLVQLEALALAAAGAGWWRRRSEPGVRVAWAMAAVAAAYPLLAIHEGTFVGVARPLEPFVAAWAAIAITELGRDKAEPFATQHPWLRPLAALLLLGALLVRTAPSYVSRSGEVDASVAWTDQLPAADAVAPPYYAAVSGRTLRRDHPYWPVWGRRAAAGTEPDQSEAAALVRDLESGSLGPVIADFRLAYIPGAAEALERGYERAAEGGSAADPSVALYLPRRRSTAGAP